MMPTDSQGLYQLASECKVQFDQAYQIGYNRNLDHLQWHHQNRRTVGLLTILDFRSNICKKKVYQLVTLILRAHSFGEHAS